MANNKKKIVIAITGATGAIYGLELLKQLKVAKIETHLILSQWAKETIPLELGIDIEMVHKQADVCYEPEALAAPISSGSFLHHGMVICPCSMKTLAAIAHGFADNLISRSADVSIKEKRPLILAVRETPFSAIHLENMLKLARLGVTIMPPIISFYQNPENLDSTVKQFTGRIMDILQIPNDLVKRWQG